MSEWLIEKMQEQIDELVLDRNSWKATAETFEDFYHKTEAELTKARELIQRTKAILPVQQRTLHNDIKEFLQ